MRRVAVAFVRRRARNLAALAGITEAVRDGRRGRPQPLTERYKRVIIQGCRGNAAIQYE